MSDYEVGKIANQENRLVITNDANTFLRENFSKGQVLKEGVVITELGNVSKEKRDIHIKEFITTHEKTLHGNQTTLEWNGHRQISMEKLAEKMQKNLSVLAKESKPLEKLEKSALKEVSSAEKSTFDKVKDTLQMEGKKIAEESKAIAKTLAKETDIAAKALEKSPNGKARLLGYALDYGLDAVDIAINIIQMKQSMNEQRDKQPMQKEISRETGKSNEKLSKEVSNKGKDYER